MEHKERVQDGSKKGSAKEGIKDMVSQRLINTTQAREAMEALEEGNKSVIIKEGTKKDLIGNTTKLRLDLD